MCGLNAFLNCGQANGTVNGSNGVNDINVEEAIGASLDIIQHRGPDARGVWISPDTRVGLGHVRLSIVDLSSDGNQPFHDASHGIHAVVNGELYEHEKLRMELDLDKHYAFAGNSDCEIVIALYKKYGISCVSRLRGEFAFVLWDEQRQLLFAARDRYGIKPLYWTKVDGRVLVASEMKCFSAFGWKPEWDVKALVESGMMFHERTVFKGVYKVMPGHYLLSKDFGALEEKPYWDLDYRDKREVETRTEEEMILGVRERLLDAIRIRMRADVPIGIFLSGGVDSSAIAGMVTHLIKEEGVKAGSDRSGDISRIKCFTVQFDKDSGVDESDVARRTAEFLGLDFYTVHMDEENMARRFEDAVWHSETLSPGTNGPGRLAVSELAREKGLRVILTGEGSDEHFAGYNYFLPEILREPDPSWPSDKPFEDLRKAFLPASDQKDAFGASIITTNTSSVASRMLNNVSTATGLNRYTPAPFASWISTTPPTPTSSETSFAEGLSGLVRSNISHKWHPLHTAEYIWTKTILANIILRYLADNLDMVYQVESRPAFLDHHLTSYANFLPPSLKIRFPSQPDGRVQEKYILREAVRPFITREVYTRKKQPYKGPPRYEHNGPIHTMLKRLVTRENVDKLGFFEWAVIEDIFGRAFGANETKHDGGAVRQVMSVAQFVVLAERFGVPGVERE